MSGQTILQEVLFEFHVVGSHVKVSAVCPVRNVEVIVIGPASAPRTHLKMLARRKLERRILQLQGEV
ncbi:serine hydroxymethyltransferase [Rhodobacteraceae bacterium RKSG542]|uniref:DUF6898 family protein n=1 Tax=Pseudovibrio flavus TaxID=2529854 RepID=UPI0035282472|nr:serine hydroxymethyltransferase [Pseudovibrio flavus]